MFYLRLKEVLAAEGRPQFVVNLASGTVASVAATLLTQPFDVVRSVLGVMLVSGGIHAGHGGGAGRGGRRCHLDGGRPSHTAL